MCVGSAWNCILTLEPGRTQSGSFQHYCAFVSVCSLHKCMSFKPAVWMDAPRDVRGGPVPLLLRYAILFHILSGHGCHGCPLSGSSFWLSVHESIVSDSMQALPTLFIFTKSSPYLCRDAQSCDRERRLSFPTHMIRDMVDTRIASASYWRSFVILSVRSPVSSKSRLIFAIDRSDQRVCLHEQKSVDPRWRTKLRRQLQCALHVVLSWRKAQWGPQTEPFVHTLYRNCAVHFVV